MASDSESNKNKLEVFAAELKKHPEWTLLVSPVLRGEPERRLREWAGYSQEDVASLLGDSLQCEVLTSKRLPTFSPFPDLFATPVEMEKDGQTVYRYRLRDKFLPQENAETKERHKGAPKRTTKIILRRPSATEMEETAPEAVAERTYDPARDAEPVTRPGRSGINLNTVAFTKYDPAQHDFALLPGNKMDEYGLGVVRVGSRYALVIREKNSNEAERLLMKAGLLPSPEQKDGNPEVQVMEHFRKWMVPGQLAVFSPLPEVLARSIARTYGVKITVEDSLDKLVATCRKNDALFAPWRKEVESSAEEGQTAAEKQASKIHHAPLDETQFYQAMAGYDVQLHSWRKGDGSIDWEIKMLHVPDPSRVQSDRSEWLKTYPRSGHVLEAIQGELGIETLRRKTGDRVVVTGKPYVMPVSDQLAHKQAPQEEPTAAEKEARARKHEQFLRGRKLDQLRQLETFLAREPVFEQFTLPNEDVTLLGKKLQASIFLRHENGQPCLMMAVDTAKLPQGWELSVARANDTATPQPLKPREGVETALFRQRMKNRVRPELNTGPVVQEAAPLPETLPALNDAALEFLTQLGGIKPQGAVRNAVLLSDADKAAGNRTSTYYITVPIDTAVYQDLLKGDQVPELAGSQWLETMQERSRIQVAPPPAPTVIENKKYVPSPETHDARQREAFAKAIAEDVMVAARFESQGFHLGRCDGVPRLYGVMTETQFTNFMKELETLYALPSWKSMPPYKPTKTHCGESKLVKFSMKLTEETFALMLPKAMERRKPGMDLIHSPLMRDVVMKGLAKNPKALIELDERQESRWKSESAVGYLPTKTGKKEHRFAEGVPLASTLKSLLAEPANGMIQLELPSVETIDGILEALREGHPDWVTYADRVAQTPDTQQARLHIAARDLPDESKLESAMAGLQNVLSGANRIPKGYQEEIRRFEELRAIVQRYGTRVSAVVLTKGAGGQRGERWDKLIERPQGSDEWRQWFMQQRRTQWNGQRKNHPVSDEEFYDRMQRADKDMYEMLPERRLAALDKYPFGLLHQHHFTLGRRQHANVLLMTPKLAEELSRNAEKAPQQIGSEDVAYRELVDAVRAHYMPDYKPRMRVDRELLSWGTRALVAYEAPKDKHTDKPMAQPSLYLVLKDSRDRSRAHKLLQELYRAGAIEGSSAGDLQKVRMAQEAAEKRVLDAEERCHEAQDLVGSHASRDYGMLMMQLAKYRTLSTENLLFHAKELHALLKMGKASLAYQTAFEGRWINERLMPLLDEAGAGPLREVLDKMLAGETPGTIGTELREEYLPAFEAALEHFLQHKPDYYALAQEEVAASRQERRAAEIAKNALVGHNPIAPEALMAYDTQGRAMQLDTRTLSDASFVTPKDKEKDPEKGSVGDLLERAAMASGEGFILRVPLTADQIVVDHSSPNHLRTIPGAVAKLGLEPVRSTFRQELTRQNNTPRAGATHERLEQRAKAGSFAQQVKSAEAIAVERDEESNVERASRLSTMAPERALRMFADSGKSFLPEAICEHMAAYHGLSEAQGKGR